MKNRTVYQTSNGIYIGEAVAHESPLEPGVFHIPGGCVETPPPATTADQVARWTGSAWKVESLPKPEPEPEPEPLTPEEIAAREKAQKIGEARAYLYQTDWIVIKIAEAAALGHVDVDSLKIQYAQELLERSRARTKINDLE
jgi:hypothetical protein